MRPLVFLPSIAAVAGAAAGVLGSVPALPAPFANAAAGIAVLLVIACVLLCSGHRRPRLAAPLAVAVVFVIALVSGATARDRALETSLRRVLDVHVGGADISSLGPVAPHAPIVMRATLREDAALVDDQVSMRVAVRMLRLAGTWQPVDGIVSLSVGGGAAADEIAGWRAGRTIDAPVTFRRPARYLNDGVPDFERALALGGTTLFASAKSALLIDVVGAGRWFEERAADVRAHVRQALARHVGPRSPLAAALAAAVLIGDRSGLPDDIRDRLQAAGTYHVVAISGGNIAILATLVAAVLASSFVRGRLAAATTILLLLAYAQVVTAGPSVWRATAMVVLYLGARLFDHRTPAWHAAALAAGGMALIDPLDVRDPGFLLTFGATAALLEVGRVASGLRMRRVAAWLLASIAASLAVEIVLLPIAATAFSRLTMAGLVLNLVAVPAMGVLQVAGLVVVLSPLSSIADAGGWVVAGAAWSLVESARLVDILPWLTRRVPSPAVATVVIYYLSLIAAVRAPAWRWRGVAAVVTTVAFVVIVQGPPARSIPPGRLRLAMFDVGQGESMLVETPDGGRMLVDTGGRLFGSGSFDIGARVLAPALWAGGVRRLDTLDITHGDPDHLGGAVSVLMDFAPAAVWWGIDVPPHGPTQRLLRAAEARSRVLFRRRGEQIDAGGARVRVLHPPEPDWERPRVRNDDSIVLEIVYRDVAILLTGDISAVVEREILPLVTPARHRVLKVGHHGSRTSTSMELLNAWQPQIALISAGRGNTFGHPTPEVLSRLQSIGARIYRTDLHGQITLVTDGSTLQVATFTGEGQ